jgi:hypothetical protein
MPESRKNNLGLVDVVTNRRKECLPQIARITQILAAQIECRILWDSDSADGGTDLRKSDFKFNTSGSVKSA